MDMYGGMYGDHAGRPYMLVIFDLGEGLSLKQVAAETIDDKRIRSCRMKIRQ